LRDNAVYKLNKNLNNQGCTAKSHDLCEQSQREGEEGRAEEEFVRDFQSIWSNFRHNRTEDTENARTGVHHIQGDIQRHKCIENDAGIPVLRQTDAHQLFQVGERRDCKGEQCCWIL
jgi:hypothetical protein